ncbi:U3 small nucleolar RNA-associated protein 18-like [Vitis vinifera]|uniref:U3 small nucleolar RNA-associated protein 18-like n=1 Tax=Vitis vinifera TaxID=29760 RepID=A0A438GMJ4_VITVI|nr:U3 small nucleolar RNA-associated protein 18-like [Vitis vinifera]
MGFQSPYQMGMDFAQLDWLGGEGGTGLHLPTMSLISQNILPKNRINKTKREDIDIPSPLEGNEDIEDRKELGPDTLRIKRRKKERKEEEKQLEVEQEREMKKLENLLFGSLYAPVEFGKGGEEEVRDMVGKDSALFFTDRSANSSLSVYEEDAELPEESNDEEDTKQRKPVWVDEEEERTNINIAKVNRLRKLRKEEDESVISGSAYVSRLRAQHVKLNPGTEWAQLDSQLRDCSSYDDESSDEENGAVVAPGYKDVEAVDDILRTDEDLIVKSSTKLLPGLLEYSRLIDANAEDPSNGPINSVQFHRNAQLLLTAGLDRRLRFFQIDGKRNTKIQSIFLDDCPIRKASFLPDGSQVIIAGRRKFFYSFDLVKARVDKIGPLTGYILLVSSRTKELIGTVKMNGTVRSLAFTDDGKQLLSSGGDGHIYHWDLRTRTCFHKAIDEGCINGTSLCASPNGALFAAGSSSGIVNVYNKEEFLGGKRKPIKTIENLTTKVDFLKFNNDAQILAISSSMKKNSLKLIHIPSYTVYSNWPPPNRTLHYPRCLDFSPGGGFMAVGNAAGKVLLYKLHHYQHA